METRYGALLDTLAARFAANMPRHEGVAWADVRARLEASDKLWSLQAMEDTGGEPDVVCHDAVTDEYILCDCAAETPAGRRNLCYDGEAMAGRRDNPPAGNAVDMAASMGIALLGEDEYRWLQKLGAFDEKTSSWIVTPPAIRALGGALFCDRRYNHVFTYHNGAASYYAARGFRGMLRV